MIPYNSEEIKEIILKGESETTEFIEKLGSDSTISKYLTSFANTNGGILVLGVTDSGQIVGIPNEEVNPAIFRLTKIIDPLLPLSTNVSIVEIDNKNIVFAAVEKAPDYISPLFTSTGQTYIRALTHSNSVPSTDFYPLVSQEKILTVEPSTEIQGFVAMSFRNEEEPHLEDYFNAMNRAVKQTGLPIKLLRVDMVEGDFEISQEIMDQIDEAEIMIADFTLNSKNVYFELGYARGKARKIIQTARSGTDLEFDIRNWRTHFYRNATELESKLVPELKLAYSEITKT